MSRENAVGLADEGVAMVYVGQSRSRRRKKRGGVEGPPSVAVGRGLIQQRGLDLEKSKYLLGQIRRHWYSLDATIVQTERR